MPKPTRKTKLEITQNDFPSYCIRCSCGDSLVWQKFYQEFYCIDCDVAYELIRKVVRNERSGAER